MSRILAVRQDNNGDVLLTGPALRGLRHASNAITLLCAPSGAAAAALMPEVDDILVMRAEWIAGDPGPIDRDAVETSVDAIARRSFDQAFIFTSFHQSALPMALLLRLAGVPKVHAISVDYPGSLLDTRARPNDDMHEVERNISLIEAAGLAAPADRSLRLRALPPIAHLDLPAFFIAIQPGASVPARAWAPERNRETVEALVARGYDVVVTGSAGERAVCAYVAAGRAIDVSGATSFGEFCAVIDAASALIVGNTAGAHVAAATGTPVVSLFPPTIPAVRFAPWNVPHVLLGDQSIACAGCRARLCPIEGQPCIGGLEATDVLAALRALGVAPAAVPA